MFEPTNIARNSDKSKHTYSGYGLAFGDADSWSFSNRFPRNVLFVSIDNSSSFYTGNHKNIFLVLGKGPTYGINNNVGTANKKCSINLSNPMTHFFLSLHYNVDNSYLFVNEKRSLKPMIKISTFQLSFV